MLPSPSPASTWGRAAEPSALPVAQQGSEMLGGREAPVTARCVVNWVAVFRKEGVLEGSAPQQDARLWPASGPGEVR